jgi:hypothetical protein
MSGNVRYVEFKNKDSCPSLILAIISLSTCFIAIVGLTISIIGLVRYTKFKKIKKSVNASLGIIMCLLGLLFSITFTTMTILIFINVYL